MRVPCKCEERTCGHSHRVHASFFSQYFELVSCSVWIFRLSAAAVAQWNVLCGFTPTLTVLFLPVRYFLLGFSLLFPLAYGFCTQVYCKFLYRIRLTLPSPVHSNLSLRSHNKTSFFFFCIGLDDWPDLMYKRSYWKTKWLAETNLGIP